MSLRPSVSKSVIHEITTEKYCLQVKTMEELVSFEDRNFRIVTDNNSNTQISQNFIIKVLNLKTVSPGVLECRRKVMAHLEEEGFICTQVLPTNTGEYCHIIHTANSGDDEEITCAVQLLTYIPGDTLEDHLSAVDQSTLYQLGQFVGKLHKSLKLLPVTDKTVLERTDDPWVLENFSLLEDFMSSLEDEDQKEIILQVIHMFKSEVLHNSQQFTKGVIHNDLHDLNIIVNCQNGKIKPIHPKDTDSNDVIKMFGIIDFNDLAISCYIFEVAKWIKDLMCDVETVESLDICAHVLAGYLKEQTLSKPELNVLYVCILAGLCQYIVLSEHEFKLQPDNDYTRLGSDEAWIQLSKLWKIPKSEVIDRWCYLLEKIYHLNIELKI